MTPEVIIRKRRDSDMLPYERHFLVDRDTSRCYGYVETPTCDELLFEASPFGDKSRYYTELDPALAYLQESAMRCAVSEGEEFTKKMEGNETSVPARADDIIATAVDRICSDAGKTEGSE